MRTRIALSLIAGASLLFLPAITGSQVPTAHAMRPAAWSTVDIKGLSTKWRLTMLSIQSMYRIPHTSWISYTRTSFYRMWVVMLRLSNVGTHRADPYDDLHLVLRVMPPYPTNYGVGFLPVLRTDKPLNKVSRDAAKEYGGAVPWAITSPGRTTTYCFVFATNRGDSHYGFYNVVYPTPQYPSYQYNLLYNTGY